MAAMVATEGHNLYKRCMIKPFSLMLLSCPLHFLTMPLRRWWKGLERREHSWPPLRNISIAGSRLLLSPLLQRVQDLRTVIAAKRKEKESDWAGRYSQWLAWFHICLRHQVPRTHIPIVSATDAESCYLLREQGLHTVHNPKTFCICPRNFVFKTFEFPPRNLFPEKNVLPSYIFFHHHVSLGPQYDDTNVLQSLYVSSCLRFTDEQ